MKFIGLPRLQKPHDAIDMTKKTVEKCLRLRDAIFKTDTHVIELYDEISNNICALLDPMECNSLVHQDKTFKEAALESLSIMQPFVQKLNGDANLYRHLEHFSRNSSLEGEKLAIMNSCLDEYASFGFNSPSRMDEIQQNHAELCDATTQFDRLSQFGGHKAAKMRALMHMLGVKKRLAANLGHQNYLELILRNKMLSSTREVKRFLDFRLNHICRSSFTLDFPSVEVKNWNSVPNLILKVSTIADTTYGIRLAYMYNDDVNGLYHLTYKNSSSDQIVGTIIADLAARKSKNIGPSHFTLLGSKQNVIECVATGLQSSPQLPIVYISCNAPDTSSLAFDDIKSIFHEFGHAFHGIFSWLFTGFH